MRRSFVGVGLMSFVLLTGCWSERKPPYANDPVLLHYKPTLSNSATILAEKQARRGPTQPPAPQTAIASAANATSPARPLVDPNLLPAKSESADQLLPPPPSAQSAMAQPAETPAPTVSSSLPVRPQNLGIAPETETSPSTPSAEVVTANRTETTLLPPPDPTPTPIAQKSIEPVVAKKAESVSEKPLEPPTPAKTAASAKVVGKYGHDKDYRWIQGVLERHYRGYLCVRYCDPSEEDPHGGKVRLQGDDRLTQFKDGDVVTVEGELIPNSTDAFNTNPLYKVRDMRAVQQK